MFSQPGKLRNMRALWIIPGLVLVAPVSAPELDAQERDFLLRTPTITFAIRGGYTVPRLGGPGDTQSLWDFTRQHLTVEDRDLAGPHVTVELGVHATERLDLAVSVGHSSASVLSEFRQFVGSDDLPINQTTEYTTTPVTAGIKAYLLPRGRSVGSYAWIPRSFNAFVGVAGGMVWYRFEQYGEFVDYETLDIFITNLQSREKGATVHFFTGMDFSINERLLLTGEARYGFAEGPLQRNYHGYSDFVGFPPLDLSALKLSVGLGVRL